MPYEPPDWLARGVSTFGRSAREQLSTGAGEPEQALLRAPLVALVKEIGSQHGLQLASAADRAGFDVQAELLKATYHRTMTSRL